MNGAISVLIADDQRMFAESIKYIIESRASDIEVVGIAQNGREAVSMVSALHPRIVLMDVRMPGTDGVEATRLIMRQWPDVKIIMLTTFDDDEYVHASLKHGAVGYLLKSLPPLELINAMRAVEGGIVQIDPSVARTLVRGTHAESANEEVLASLRTLTRREREVLGLVVQALDNQQIARTLHVAEQTVRNYVSTIYAKLGVANRMDVLKIVDTVTQFLDLESER